MLLNASAVLSCTSSLSSCGKVVISDIIYVKYPIGSILYNYLKALVGKVEKVRIKKYQYSESAGGGIILYVDSMNDLWNESDLCREQIAIATINNYLLVQAAKQERERFIDCDIPTMVDICELDCNTFNFN